MPNGTRTNGLSPKGADRTLAHLVTVTNLASPTPPPEPLMPQPPAPAGTAVGPVPQRPGETPSRRVGG